MNASPDVSETTDEVHDCLCPVCGNRMRVPREMIVTDKLIFYHGERLLLAGRITRLLSFMIRHKNMVISRDWLWEQFYGGSKDGNPEPGIFNVYMVKIRRAITAYNLPFKLETIYGEGWILSDG